MNAKKYQKVLETQLPSQVKIRFKKREKPIFMHDDAPCHRAQKITKFLAEQKVGILDWP